MPTEKSQSAGNDRPGSVAANPTDGVDVTAHDSDKARTDASSGSNPSTSHLPIQSRRLLLGIAAALILAVILVFGIPRVRLALTTVSTDDAFVNGHVTFVAPRVRGQVARVLVDDNNRVHKGDL